MTRIINTLIVCYLPPAIIIVVLFMLGFSDREFLFAFIIAAFLNILNSLLFFYFYKRGIKGTNKTFLFYILGGMAGRMILILAAFLFALKFLKIDEYSFILIFFIIYFISLAAEIGYILLQNRNKRGIQAEK